MACQLEPPGGGGALARRQGTRGVLVREALALFGLGWTCLSGDQHGLGFPVPRRARVDARTLGRRRAPLRESAHDQRTCPGARPWLAYTQEDHARMLLERQAPGDL